MILDPTHNKKKMSATLNDMKNTLNRVCDLNNDTIFLSVLSV